MPTKVLAVELTQPLQAIPLDNRYDSVKILVCVNNKPLKWIVFYGLNKNEVIQPRQVLEEIRKKTSWQLVMNYIVESKNTWLVSKMSPSCLEPISIVICILNNGIHLESCLSALLQCRYSKLEIVIVDVMPVNDVVLNLVSRFSVKYIRENRKGLNNARNRGIEEASHDIIGFIDPDIAVSKHWCNAIAAALANSEVIGVSGYVAPLKLETAFQRAFEANYKDMGSGLDSSIIRRPEFNLKKLVWIASLGLRTNIAFRKKAFTQLGFFDVSFDKSLSRFGIIDFIDRVLVKGYAVASEPSMFVWQNNQNDAHIIKKNVFEFSKLFWCYATHCFFTTEINKQVLFKFLFKHWLLKRNILNLFKHHGGVPKKFTIEEFKGVASGLSMWNNSIKKNKPKKQYQINS